MRRFEKKLINDLLDKLTDIQKNISSEYKAGHTESAVTLLCQCQDSAVSIGNMIESREGKDCPSIKFLERYCDSLYSTAQKIVAKTITKNDFDTIRKHHFNIFQSIEKEIPTRLEMLFLPYQASMWDSLESIWKAAHEDPYCDVFVVPIPYFERKPDGSVGILHYEGDRFPDYVPITHYTKYDLRLRKPDAVFIHNPYDANNYVTMVAPEYFSTELKKHTDCLVYVPYFAFASMNNIEKNFFLMPGVFNADYVIAQSDEIKNAYIDAYEQYTGKKAVKNKYLPLGSPLLDKVISTKREDVQVPEEWKNKIVDKKVVLYNTSIKGILDNREKALEKIEDVFRTFQKEKNVVLLWRPHPLIPATISGMLPHLVDRYQELVEQFKKNNRGIYDDTSDMYRSIAISDAYYGDASSLLPMFGLTGKPVLVQNIAKTGYKKADIPNAISFDNWFREGSTAWFPANNFNGLIEIDLETMNTNLLAEFPTKPNKISHTISGFTKCGNLLVFAASEESCIFCYDMSAHSMSSIPYDLPPSFAKYNNSNFRFWASYAFQDDVYFFGHRCPVILQLNLSSKKVNFITDWFSEIERLICNSKEAAYLTVGMQYGDKYYAPCCRANAVVELSLENGITKIIEIPNSGNGFSGIAFDGNKFWLSPRSNGPILSWDKETCEIKEYLNYPGSENKSRISFKPIFYQNGFIWLAPTLADKMLKIRCDDGSIYEVSELNEICNQVNKKTPDFPAKFRACLPGEGSILWLNDGASYSLIRFDTSDGSIKRFNLMTPDIQEQLSIQKEVNHFILPKKAEQSLKDILEGKTRQLRDYLNFIENYTNEQSFDQTSLFNELFSNVDGSCGEKTYNAIKKVLRPR